MKYSKDKIMSHLYHFQNGEYKKSIRGWWKDSTFEIYEALDSTQEYLKIEGNLCEIGTWYGRSFLPLRNFTKEHETCIGIDIFKSTRQYDVLINKVIECFGNLDQCKIIKIIKKGSTQDKIANLKQYSPIRIFYIDGDHSYAGATIDLKVAKACLHEKGIVFLDDYDNPNFGLNIRKAINGFLKENKEFSLAFSSTQRVFLCQTDMVDTYISCVKQLNWKVNRDKIWRNLINFEHPDGYNSWKYTHSKND